MTLEKTLRQQLNSTDPGGFHFHAAGWDVTLTSDQRDRLSCALKELTLERNTPIAEELKPWAERVAGRATGLLESLRLIEIDQPIGRALLRSETPTVQDGKVFYYELWLERTDRTSANLRRYAGDRVGGDKREAVSFVLTHDAIVKIVSDLVSSN